MVKLLDIGEIITGTTPSTKIKEYWGTGYPFVTPSDFTTDKYVNKTEREVTKTGAEKARLIPKNSVMVTCIASVGEVAMASEECVTNQQINTIICKETINPHFIYYSMLFEKGRLKRWAGSTTSPIIKKSLFEKFLLSLPSLTEQQKIAEILGTVDEAIQRVDEVIEKTKRLKQGLMKELLTKGIGHKEFKDSEIGRIPKKWEATKAEEVFCLEYGEGLVRSDRDNGKFPVFGSNGIVGYHSKYLIKGPGIIVGRKGTIGAVTWSEEDFWPIDTAYYINLKYKDINLKWLYYKLISLNLPKLNMATGVPGLNREIVHLLKFAIPLKEEQQEIVDILTTFDSKIETEKKRKERLERIKKELMEELLTGKKRVKI